jgi:SanA protein
MSMPKKIFRLLLALFALGAAVVLGINLLILLSTRDRILDSAENFGVDCVLVLGARVYSSGSLSPVLQDRMDTGIRQYELGAGKKLLLSGDHGQKEYDEVNAMKRYAQEQGVPEEDLFLDHAGFSTYESLARLKEVFGAKKVVIVTQRYHLSRALYIARSLGLEAWGVAADLRPYAGQLRFEAREVLARCKDFVYCLFKPDPTYLGNPIDLSGSGSQTYD